MGVQVHIDDDTGQTYRAWFNADSKKFAQLLLNSAFWSVFEHSTQCSTHAITNIVAEQHVPNRLRKTYPTWEDYVQSRYQPIDPVIETVEKMLVYTNMHKDWLQLLQQEWEKDDRLRPYLYEFYFEEGEFISDLEGLLQRLRQIKSSGANTMCIYLL